MHILLISIHNSLNTLYLWFTIAYYYHPAKYHNGGKDFLPGKCVHTYPNAYYNGNDRLHVAVHTHKGWTDNFLSKRNKSVCDKCGTNNKICQFVELHRWHCAPRSCEDFFCRKWERHYKSIKENRTCGTAYDARYLWYEGIKFDFWRC